MGQRIVAAREVRVGDVVITDLKDPKSIDVVEIEIRHDPYFSRVLLKGSDGVGHVFGEDRLMVLVRRPRRRRKA